MVISSSEAGNCYGRWSCVVELGGAVDYPNRAEIFLDILECGIDFGSFVVDLLNRWWHDEPKPT